jgi:hypothetical protein
MGFAKDHWKTLIILIALAGGIGSAVAFDSPVIQGLTGTSTPTPIVTAGPTPTPNSGDSPDGRVKAGTFGITITLPPTKPPVHPTLASCQGGLAIDLLLDTSSSMKQPEDNPKIDALKEAVSNIISQIPDEAVVGVQTFDKKAQSVFGPEILKDGKGDLKDDIDELKPSGEGGTHTQEGLYKAKKMIEEGNTTYPGRGWTLILISDGSPYPYPDQDGTDVANQLKDDGIKIVTIGLDLDQEVNVSPEKAKELMRDMASSPAEFYDANSDDIGNIYRVLAEKFCK